MQQSSQSSDIEYQRLLNHYDVLARKIPLSRLKRFEPLDPREVRQQSFISIEKKKKFFSTKTVDHILVPHDHPPKGIPSIRNRHNYEFISNPRETPFFSLHDPGYTSIAKVFDPRLTYKNDVLGETVFDRQVFVEETDEIWATNDLIFDNLPDIYNYTNTDKLELRPDVLLGKADEQSKEISSSSKSPDHDSIPDEMEYRDSLLEETATISNMKRKEPTKPLLTRTQSLLQTALTKAAVVTPDNSFIEEISLQATPPVTPFKLSAPISRSTPVTQCRSKKNAADPENSFLEEIDIRTKIQLAQDDTPETQKKTVSPPVSSQTPNLPTPVDSNYINDTDNIKPIDSRKSSDSSKPTDSSKHTDSRKSTDASKSTDTSKSTDSIKPIQENLISSSEEKKVNDTETTSPDLSYTLNLRKETIESKTEENLIETPPTSNNSTEIQTKSDKDSPGKQIEKIADQMKKHELDNSLNNHINNAYTESTEPKSSSNSLLDVSLSSIRNLKGEHLPRSRKRTFFNDSMKQPKSPILSSTDLRNTLDQKFKKLPIKDRDIAKQLQHFCVCWVEEIKHATCVEGYSEFLFLIDNRYSQHIPMQTINAALGVLLRNSEIQRNQFILRTALFTSELLKLLSSQ